MKKAKTGKKSGMSKGEMVAVGAGVAALSAGAYYLMGPNKKAHQKKAKALYVKMKKEVSKDLKKVKVLTAPLYNKAVDKVSEAYSKQYKAHGAEIKSFARKLKAEAKKMTNKAVKQAVKTVKAKAKKAISKAKPKGKKRK